LRIFVAGCEPTDWYQSQIDNLSSSYLNSAPTEQLAGELIRMIKAPSDEVKTWSKYSPESQTVEYTIATYESVTSGIFHKLTGALTSQGLQILSADIHTLDHGLVLDRFKVTDPDFAGEPPMTRLEQINELLSQSLLNDQPPTFRRLWRNADRKKLDSVTRRPTQFHADNNTSQQFTILDIFAMDRMGLLYTISKMLFDLGLSVATAKIGTYLDQVVDVFYVTDREGNKIEDEQLQVVRKRVLQAIDEAETASSTD
jgi:[protein-PII] uridylyltransferase